MKMTAAFTVQKQTLISLTLLSCLVLSNIKAEGNELILSGGLEELPFTVENAEFWWSGEVLNGGKPTYLVLVRTDGLGLTKSKVGICRLGETGWSLRFYQIILNFVPDCRLEHSSDGRSFLKFSNGPLELTRYWLPDGEDWSLNFTTERTIKHLAPKKVEPKSRR